MDNLPVSWTEKRLREITTKPQYGYTASASTRKKGPKFVRITDITKENIDWETVPYCECSREIFHKYKLELKDLLFARTGSTGSSILITELPEPAVFASYLIRLKIKKGMEAEYLTHFFNSWFYWRQIQSLKVGAVQSGINASVLSSLKIPVPPLVEQRGIVEVLGTVDECIRLTDAVIERAEELKRGLMQQLLTRGIRHTEYKETPLGEIPKTWKIEKIGKSIKLLNGFAFKSDDYVENGIPLLRISNVSFGIVNINNTVYLPEEYLKKHSDFCLKKNDVVLALTRPITEGGIKAAIINDEFNLSLLNQRVGVFRVKNDDVLSLNYLYYYMFTDYFIKQIRLGLLAMHQPNISTKNIENIKIKIPPIKEQNTIVEILQSIEGKIEFSKIRKEKLRTLKQGLMQQLFSGKIRVELKGDGLHRIRDSREANN